MEFLQECKRKENEEVEEGCLFPRWSVCYTSQPIVNYVNNLHCPPSPPSSFVFVLSLWLLRSFGFKGAPVWPWCVPFKYYSGDGGGVRSAYDGNILTQHVMDLPGA